MRLAPWKVSFVAALLAASTGCAFGQRTIRVDWPPSGEKSAPPAPPSAPAVALLGVVDQRPEPRRVVGCVRNGFGMLTSNNGSVWYLSFPVELVEQLQLGPLRLGAGASLSLAPRYTGTGVASSLSIPFQESIGGLLEARFVFPFHGPSGRGLGIGPRFLWQRLTAEKTGASISANALGISIDYTL